MKVLAGSIKQKQQKRPMFFFFLTVQETGVFLKESGDGHALIDKTPVKEPTLSYDNEPCTLDLESSSDNIVKVRELKNV